MLDQMPARPARRTSAARRALLVLIAIILIGSTYGPSAAQASGALPADIGGIDTDPAHFQSGAGKPEHPGKPPQPPPTPPPLATPTPAEPTPTSAATVAPIPTAAPTLSSSPTPAPQLSTTTAVGEVHIRPGDPLQARIDVAAPGTIFILHAGTYSKLKPRNGITLQSAGDGEVVISGATGSWDAGIWIKGVSNVTVRGLTIRGNTLGIFLRDAPGVVIENNVITDNAYGLEIHARTTGTVVRNNRIENNDRYLDPGRKAGGMNLFHTFGGITISGNTILNNDSVGVEIYGADDAVIEGNVIAGSSDAIETGTSAGGDCKNNRIVRNVIYRVGHRPEERGIWLRCMSSSIVAHNTIHGMDMFGIGITPSGQYSGAITDLRVLNNAIVRGRGFWLGDGLPTSVTIDYNDVLPCVSGTCPAFGHLVATQGSVNYPSLATLQSGTAYMDHGLSVEPSFVDIAAQDFRIAAGSALIDRGLDLSWGHLGVAPDIGTFEQR